MELKEIKKLYPVGSLFYSATNNLKQPLVVTELRFANHTDRYNRVREINRIILETYNKLFHPQTKQKLQKEDYKNQEFFKEIEKIYREKKYLLSLPKDIVNEEGGVIYCSETDTYARRD